METYLKKGYSKEWINQRLKNTEVRKKYNSNICYVKGIKCYAQDGYLGGIVIQRFFR
jgi:hypothetical protein